MKTTLRTLLTFGLAAATLTGCDRTAEPEAMRLGSVQDAITDVAHTPVERQSIGNCWLYAQATWVESMHLSATEEELDISQSYWTYWHWFDQITGFMWGEEISTGGNQWKSNSIVRARGLMVEQDFVSEDTQSEMSDRQASALDFINDELKNGRLASSSARRDGKLVRQVMDEAWGLSDEVRAQLDQAFGEDGERSLRGGANLDGTNILDPSELAVKYTRRTDDGSVEVETNLVEAISEWSVARYPRTSDQRRDFQKRVQRALHDGQPVVITWNVDFNAMENFDPETKGSFNMDTLIAAGGPGRQGGHMTVLEDYEAITSDFGTLPAGETLDPEADADKLAAALEDDTQIVFFRTKNSWGGSRPDRAFAPGFPGYHDLYMDYMNGPIAWCPGSNGGSCSGEATPFRDVMLPPGY